MTRARDLFAFGLFVAAALLGLAAQPLWTAALVGSALALLSIQKQMSLRTRFAGIGASEVLAGAHLVSLASAMLFASCAWGIGGLLRVAIGGF